MVGWLSHISTLAFLLALRIADRLVAHQLYTHAVSKGHQDEATSPQELNAYLRRYTFLGGIWETLWWVLVVAVAFSFYFVF
ncbi:MAG: hypothetical protein AAF708_13880 [Deinococcota bacterium]